MRLMMLPELVEAGQEASIIAGASRDRDEIGVGPLPVLAVGFSRLVEIIAFSSPDD